MILQYDPTADNTEAVPIDMIQQDLEGQYSTLSCLFPTCFPSWNDHSYIPSFQQHLNIMQSTYELLISDIVKLEVSNS